MAVAYYYFDFGNESCSTVGALLRSLISQISNQVPRIPAHLEKLTETEYRSRSMTETKSASSQLSDKHLTALLLETIEKLKDIYIIIDALDECTELQKAMKLLEEMIKIEKGSLHLLFTSRSEREIEEDIGPIVTSQVLMESSFVNEDIRSFIQNRLKHDRKLRRWPQKVRDEIETRLMDGANGMYARRANTHS
jgi:hypothetical protein